MAVSHHELMYIYYNALFFYAMRTFDEFQWIVRRLLVQFTGKFFNIAVGRPVLDVGPGRGGWGSGSNIIHNVVYTVRRRRTGKEKKAPVAQGPTGAAWGKTDKFKVKN